MTKKKPVSMEKSFDAKVTKEMKEAAQTQLALLYLKSIADSLHEMNKRYERFEATMAQAVVVANQLMRVVKHLEVGLPKRKK
jgi:hypothetical protein